MRRAAGETQSGLFGARDGGAALPPVPASEAAIVGVDVGGMKKGLHAVALRHGQVIAIFAHAAAGAVVEWCLNLGACAVAVDAPCRWSTTGRTRAAERALYAEGIRAFATPTLATATAKPFYRWMLNGAELYLELARFYAPFEGGEPASRVYLETYPQAVACALASRVLCAKDKRANRRAVLSQAGMDIRRLTNIDYVDAALCAVAGAYACAGHYRAYGDPAEGMIFVPGRVTPRAA